MRPTRRATPPLPPQAGNAPRRTGRRRRTAGGSRRPAAGGRIQRCAGREQKPAAVGGRARARAPVSPRAGSPAASVRKRPPPHSPPHPWDRAMVFAERPVRRLALPAGPAGDASHRPGEAGLRRGAVAARGAADTRRGLIVDPLPGPARRCARLTRGGPRARAPGRCCGCACGRATTGPPPPSTTTRPEPSPPPPPVAGTSTSGRRAGVPEQTPPPRPSFPRPFPCPVSPAIVDAAFRPRGRRPRQAARNGAAAAGTRAAASVRAAAHERTEGAGRGPGNV